MENLYFTQSHRNYFQMMTSRQQTIKSYVSEEKELSDQTQQQLPNIQDMSQSQKITIKPSLKKLNKKDLIYKNSQSKTQEFKAENVEKRIKTEIDLFEGQQQSTIPKGNIEHFHLMLQDLSSALSDASKNEIQLNKTGNNMKELSAEFSRLKLQFEKQKQFLHLQTNELDDFRRKFFTTQIENRNLQNNLSSEVLQKNDYAKRVRILEDRLQFAVQKNLNAHKDQLNNTLGSLIRECEGLKRDKVISNKEIERHKELVGKLNARNRNLIKKLEGFKIKKTTNDDEKDVEIQQNDHFDNSLDVNQLPQNLEFRYQGISQDFKSIITDVIDHGPESFDFQIVHSEDKLQIRDLSSMISTQFLSFLEFSERMNQLIPKLILMFNSTSISQVMQLVSREFKHIFKAEQVALWLMEEQTGYLFSYDLDGHLNKVLFQEGAFHNAFFTSKIQNRKLQINLDVKEDDILLYQCLSKNGQDTYGGRFMVIPILNKDMKVCGLLELNKIYEEQMITDVQYLALVLTKFTKQIIQKIIERENSEKTLKYQQIGYQQFMELCDQQTRFKFVECVQEFAQKMFCTSNCIFLFFNSERNVFHSYKNDGTHQELDGRIGLAGQIAITQKTYISQCITKEINFNSRIDLDTFSPVYCQPVLAQIQMKGQNMSKTIAVLQFVVKGRRRVKNLQPLQGAVVDHINSLEDPINLSMETTCSDALLFAQFVSSAYTLCEDRLQQ